MISMKHRRIINAVRIVHIALWNEADDYNKGIVRDKEGKEKEAGRWKVRSI